MKRKKGEAGDVINSKIKIGKRRVLKRNEKQNKESECVGVENVSRDGVIRSAGVKSTLAAPLSRTRRWTQWVFLRRGHSLSPNTRKRAGCTDMGRKKQPELERNGTFCVDKQVTEMERSQVPRQR